MSVSLREIFNEHKWLWFLAGVSIFVAGCLTAVWLNQRSAAVDVPVMEAMKTEEASTKINETITEPRSEKTGCRR